MPHYSVGMASLQGQLRSSNQDALLAEQYAPTTLLAAVADGVGTYSHSADASNLACTYTATLVKQQYASGRLNSRTFVAGIQAVNVDLWNTATEQARALRTTFSAVLIHQGQATIAHVGDCRVYLWRDRQLTQLTRDHAENGLQFMQTIFRKVQSRLTKREISGNNSIPEQKTRRSTTVQRILGEHPIVRVDVHTVPLQTGDRFLLCSDGVWSYLTNDEIIAAMKKVRNLSTGQPIQSNSIANAEAIQADHLVNIARAKGTPDDTSAIIISVHA